MAKGSMTNELRAAAERALNDMMRAAVLHDWRGLDGSIDALRAALAAEQPQSEARPCTCHPDDNPPRPCPRKYALSECRAAEQPQPPRFPTMLRKMWSGGEVQAWIDRHWTAPPAAAPSEAQDAALLPLLVDGYSGGIAFSRPDRSGEVVLRYSTMERADAVFDALTDAIDAALAAAAKERG